MRLMTDATEYGLRAMVWLANQPREPHKLQAIADATGAASGYLIKVLQALTKAGIVSAHRGTTGGFALDRDPDTLTVLEVVSAIDPIERIRSCPLGLSAHSRELCRLHRRIDDSLAMIERDFAGTTISDLARDRSPSDHACTALSITNSCEAQCSRESRPGDGGQTAHPKG